jgi:hypothetical protein
VNVTDDVPVAVLGANDAVTPAGSPLAVNATPAVKLLSRLIVTVLVAVPAWFSATAVGLAAN